MGLAITSLSPTKAYLLEAKKSKRFESYKFNLKSETPIESV